MIYKVTLIIILSNYTCSKGFVSLLQCKDWYDTHSYNAYVINACKLRSMWRMCATVLVGVASPVSEIKLVYSPWG